MENRNLRLDADGERLVLRRYDATAPEEVPWALALLRVLTAPRFFLLTIRVQRGAAVCGCAHHR